MKLKRIIPFVLLIGLLLGFYLYMNPLLPIITGYSAKNLSSGIFVAGRTQKSLENEDLNFSFIRYVRNKVDTANLVVTSSFLWHKSKSIYVDGLGCVLENGFSEDEMYSRPAYKKAACYVLSDTIPWPEGDLLADTPPRGLNAAKLDKAMAQAFSDVPPFKGTFAVTVVYKGQIVAEKYRDDFAPDTKFLSWSMAKSYTNALVAMLVKEGKLDINQPIGFPEWKADGRNGITISHLMHMNSGLDWNEDYGNSSDVNIMLHKIGDMAQYTIDKKLLYKPDSVWVYSSGSTNIVSKIIRSKFNTDSAYYTFPYKSLFEKIGMHSAIWEVDASGTYVGSSYIYATMRDYARFGLLYLNDGCWLGERLLPEGWVDYTRKTANGSEGKYGAFFWLNNSGIDYPDVPRDMYCCRGHDGQYIYIIPSKQLVVVRTGFSKKGMFDYNAFLKNIVDAVE